MYVVELFINFVASSQKMVAVLGDVDIP